MVDRARGPIPVSALRIGRTDVGAASAVIDDDVLTVSMRHEGADRALRLRLAHIDGASIAGDELELALHDGTRVGLVSAANAELLAEILERCHSLPELTRTLRVFGSNRGQRGARSGGSGEQARFFAPLIASRRKAMDHARPADAVEAFDAPALARALDDTLHEFAVSRHVDDAPARRALEAELVDASEPLYGALRSLGEAAGEALRAPDNLGLWRAWSMQLRTTFEVADRVWVALDAVLDSASTTP